MQFVGVVIACGTMWDFVTTFVGLADIFDVFSQEGDYPFVQLIFALVVSCVIMGFVLCTHYIWRQKEGDLITVILKATWLMCFVFDVWTALLGNKRLIFGGRAEDVKSMIVIGMLTIIITSSTILLSRIIGQKEEAERERKRDLRKAVEKEQPPAPAPAPAQAQIQTQAPAQTQDKKKDVKSYQF
jgi:hypothetical protein